MPPIEIVKEQKLLYAKGTRKEDGLHLFLQSDLLEPLMKEKATNKAGEVGLSEEQCGHKSYKSLTLERFFGDYITGYGKGWKEFQEGLDYSPQLLKIVGLQDGVTIVVPSTNFGTWTQAYVTAYVNAMQSAAMKAYRQALMPVEHQLDILVREHIPVVE